MAGVSALRALTVELVPRLAGRETGKLETQIPRARPNAGRKDQQVTALLDSQGLSKVWGQLSLEKIDFHA